jgi:Rieske Fe-S protein
MSDGEPEQFSKHLVEKYGIKVSANVLASVYSSKPRLPILLPRAAFRPEPPRSYQNIRVQRERRNFLRNMLGLVAFSVPLLLWMKAAFFTPQAQIPSYVGSSVQVGGARLLTNAASIPAGQALSFNDPNIGPFLLIHLDTGQFVAYSSICTHAGCQVQFDPTSRDIACPCHGAVFDPYSAARVLAGPAPSPLPSVPIRYDSGTGNIYLA